MATNPKLKAAILIISTTASKDPSQDSSGPTLESVFEEDGGGQWEVVEKKIVGDNVLEIQRAVTQWTDGGFGVEWKGVNLIVTSGGTGFAEFDNTPEVSLKNTLLSYSFVTRERNGV